MEKAGGYTVICELEALIVVHYYIATRFNRTIVLMVVRVRVRFNSIIVVHCCMKTRFNSIVAKQYFLQKNINGDKKFTATTLYAKNHELEVNVNDETILFGKKFSICKPLRPGETINAKRYCCQLQSLKAKKAI